MPILNCDAIAGLKSLGTGTVQTCITSPPYFGLRNYGVDGQIGLESSPDEYVARLVEVFREVRRVLKADGTFWLNLGDSMGIRSNLPDCLASGIKGSVLLLGAACTLTVTSERADVLRQHKRLPDSELVTLLGVKRVFVKQRDNDLRQVINLLAPESFLRISRAVSFARIGDTDAEIRLDASDHIRIVVAELDLNSNPALKVPIRAGAVEYGQTPFAVEETGKPVAERIINVKPQRNTVSLDALRERTSQVDFVNKAIPFRDASMTRAEGLCDLRVTEASMKKFALSMMNGTVEIAIEGVSHLFFRNAFGSLISYTQEYEQSYRKSIENGPKQELGVPFRVRQALVRDGWICRQTIIWSKPNPMPESVRDRCTKAHEYVFLLSKSAKYYYNADAIKEPCLTRVKARDKNNGESFLMRGHGRGRHCGTFESRNKRSVWTITPKPYRQAHFAVMPEALVEPCILAGSRPGDIVLDPFAGACTVGVVAERLGRQFIGTELNPDYVRLGKERLAANTNRLLQAA